MNPIKGIQKPNVITLEIPAAKNPMYEIKVIKGRGKFHEIAAVDTKTASIIAVLFTAPSKVILSDPAEAEALNAEDLITGFPDFPKVSSAACFDIFKLPLGFDRIFLKVSSFQPSRIQNHQELVHILVILRLQT